MLLQILQITAPVFLLTLAGYVWARQKMPFDLEFITRLSVTRCWVIRSTHLAAPPSPTPCRETSATIFTRSICDSSIRRGTSGSRSSAAPRPSSEPALVKIGETVLLLRKKRPESTIARQQIDVTLTSQPAGFR